MSGFSVMHGIDEQLEALYRQSLQEDNLSVALKCLELRLKLATVKQSPGAHLCLSDLSDEVLEDLLNQIEQEGVE